MENGFRVEDKIDSDHRPITVWIKKGERRNFEECNRGRRGEKGDWSQEGRGVFRKEFRGLSENGEGEGKGIEEE